MSAGALLTPHDTPLTADMSAAIELLRPMLAMGYTLEAAGACVRVWGRRGMRDGCRYLSVASLLEQDEPVLYALETFKGRW